MTKKNTYGQALLLGIGLIAFSQLLLRPIFADSVNLMTGMLSILLEFIGIYLIMLGFYRWHMESTNKKESATDHDKIDTE